MFCATLVPSSDAVRTAAHPIASNPALTIRHVFMFVPPDRGILAYSGTGDHIGSPAAGSVAGFRHLPDAGAFGFGTSDRQFERLVRQVGEVGGGTLCLGVFDGA